MKNSVLSRLACLVVLAFALGLTGCGDTKKVEPKADPNAKPLPQQTPGGVPGSGKPTGGKGAE